MGCSTLVLTKDCKAANFVAGGKSVTLNACGVLVRPIEELNLVGVGKMAAGTLENISGQPDADSWYPRPEDLTHSNVARLVRELELTDYDALYRFSVEKPGDYWRAVSRFCGMVWSKDFSHFVDLSRGKEFPKWFVGGELNWTETVFARADDPLCAKRSAVIAETEGGEITQVSYAELHERVRGFAAGLIALRIGKGDRVGMLMEPGIEATVTLLAIVYIGAIFVPLYSGFGVDPILARLSSVGARALIATTGFKRRGRRVDTTDIALEVGRRLGLDVLVMKGRAGEPLTAGTIDWAQVAATRAAPALTATRTSPGDPFMVIHTSGTTGLPKGTVHTHGGVPMKIAHDALLQ